MASREAVPLGSAKGAIYGSDEGIRHEDSEAIHTRAWSLRGGDRVTLECISSAEAVNYPATGSRTFKTAKRPVFWSLSERNRPNNDRVMVFRSQEKMIALGTNRLY